MIENNDDLNSRENSDDSIAERIIMAVLMSIGIAANYRQDLDRYDTWI